MSSQSQISPIPTVPYAMHDTIDNIRLLGFDYLTDEDPLPAVVDTTGGYVLFDGSRKTLVKRETTDET